jgi:hypothetical protein
MEPEASLQCLQSLPTDPYLERICPYIPRTKCMCVFSLTEVVFMKSPSQSEGLFDIL